MRCHKIATHASSYAALAICAMLFATAPSARPQDRKGPESSAPTRLYTPQNQLAAAAAKAASARPPRANPAATPNAAKFISFDVPAAANGTYPLGINNAGAVTGYYTDANYMNHGFLRTAGGNFTTFDVPGGAQGTYPEAIDSHATITGHYCEANALCHGFTRSSDGLIATFDPADIAGTYPLSISKGMIAGYYYDADYVGRGFVRGSNGSLVTFEVPGALNGTYAASVSSGFVAGAYVDASYVTHGFLRANGHVTTFDPPGAMGFYAPYSYGPGVGVNSAGTVVGTFFETIAGNPFGGNYRGYVRSSSGNYTTFDATTDQFCCLWTFAYNVNTLGVVTGSYNDSSSINHGFTMTPGGTITLLDAPAAGTGFNQGTVPLSINDTGVLAGFYIDSNYVYHGFVYKP